MHVSNRHMELSSVVAGIAHANGLVSRMNNRAARDDEDDANYVFTSTVVISAREEADFDTLREDSRLERDRAAGRAAHLDRRLFQRGRRDLAPVSQTWMRFRAEAPADAGEPAAQPPSSRAAARSRRRRTGGQGQAIGRTRCRSNASISRMRAAKSSPPCSTVPPGSRSRSRCSRTASPAARTMLAAKRIAEGLTARGIAVLRFDFTGLGASEGEFANTTFLLERRRPGRGGRSSARR